MLLHAPATPCFPMTSRTISLCEDLTYLRDTMEGDRQGQGNASGYSVEQVSIPSRYLAALLRHGHATLQSLYKTQMAMDGSVSVRALWSLVSPAQHTQKSLRQKCHGDIILLYAAVEHNDKKRFQLFLGPPPGANSPETMAIGRLFPRAGVEGRDIFPEGHPDGRQIRIRAVQGHSGGFIDAAAAYQELRLEEELPPLVIHATNADITSIMQQGLLPGGPGKARDMIHFATGHPGRASVRQLQSPGQAAPAARQGRERDRSDSARADVAVPGLKTHACYHIYLNLPLWLHRGNRAFMSANRVVLIDAPVSAEFFTRVVDVRRGVEIQHSPRPPPIPKQAPARVRWEWERRGLWPRPKPPPPPLPNETDRPRTGERPSHMFLLEQLEDKGRQPTEATPSGVPGQASSSTAPPSFVVQQGSGGQRWAADGSG